MPEAEDPKALGGPYRVKMRTDAEDLWALLRHQRVVQSEFDPPFEAQARYDALEQEATYAVWFPGAT